MTQAWTVFRREPLHGGWKSMLRSWVGVITVTLGATAGLDLAGGWRVWKALRSDLSVLFWGVSKGLSLDSFRGLWHISIGIWAALLLGALTLRLESWPQFCASPCPMVCDFTSGNLACGWEMRAWPRPCVLEAACGSPRGTKWGLLSLCWTMWQGSWRKCLRAG